MMKKDFYTTEEAAEILKVSKKSLEGELRLGRIKASKRFSRWYILHRDLIEYIEQGRYIPK